VHHLCDHRQGLHRPRADTGRKQQGFLEAAVRSHRCSGRRGVPA
jgi:hypothetical protein